MRYFSKGREPRHAETWRAGQPDATWDEVPSDVKDAMRKALCQEQSCLCAYCQRRIRDVPTAMRIEHWQPRNPAAGDDPRPDRTLGWTNLLGVCLGTLATDDAGRRTGGTVETCDRAKGNRPLTWHPGLDPRVDEVFRYMTDGSITSSEGSALADISTLNLNHSRLKRSRAVVLEELRVRLGMRRWSAADLRRELERWTVAGSEGCLPELTGVAAYHLRRWAASR